MQVDPAREKEERSCQPVLIPEFLWGICREFLGVQELCAGVESENSSENPWEQKHRSEFLNKKKQEANQSSEGLTSPLELALIRALSFFFLDFIWQKKFKSVLSPLNDLHCGLEGLKKIII